ncbi:cation channel sperm-associated protein subunit epsilon isoform X2 [Coturnix japonica]|uniref:cation channel sperm-associated protein subunit epsilon isoform X2 n=1 Tax=Coturnix japonica TaxID=93934 RepID=UPI000777060C|nr:cation channel sperm-associated protein subunit epsilon isoform X2 [Coturnix japonica]
MGPVWPLLVLPLLLRPQGACALPRCRTAEENHELFTSRKDTFEDEEQYLPASDHSSCFMCYATIASEMEGADQLFLTEHQLILWIYDPESADASELNHTAVFPSEVLNKLLWILGQKPADQNYFKQKMYCSEKLPKFSTCYKREARRVFKLGAEHKLPESEILGVHSRYWCSTAYPVQMGKQSSTLAAQRSSEVSAMRMIYINSALSPGLLWDDVFTAPIKTAQIMDIFMCLDQHYQKCQMAALSTRLFLEFKFSRQTDYILESNYTQALELTGSVMSAELKPTIENACKLQHEASFLSEAQSWHMMLKESKNSAVDDIRGPQNYRSCFELLENSSKEGLNEQYQALNCTSQNHIAWPFSHDATRVFRVRISDRNYRSDVYMAKLYSFITLSIMLVCTTFWCTYSLTWKPETLGGFPQSSDKT